MEVISNKTYDVIRPLLTVFTPAYNRADTIVRTYASLCGQTNKDFKWIIVDDGSTDGTEGIVKEWLKEEKVPIKYIKKENGGLVTGYNTAVENVETELNVCIDSDDYMPENAVELIHREWAKVENPNIAGLIGLDMKEGTDKAIGGEMSKTGDFYYVERFTVVRHTCDAKVVCRTSLMKEIWPMPTFGEKHFNPNTYYHIIGDTYKFRLINEVLCIVDYQPDGMMAGIYRQYKNSPKSFAEMRKIQMRSNRWPLKRQFELAAHYVSSSIFLKNLKFIGESPRPILTIAAVPFGCLLHGYILFKLWKGRRKKIKV